MTFLYIIQSLDYENKFYLGITDRKKQRLEEHNRGQNRSTKKFKPWETVYTEEYRTKSEAIKREFYLKSINGFRERLEIIKKYRKW